MSTAALLYWTIGKGLFGGATRAVVRTRAYGTERIPRHGGAVLAVNHASWVDIPVVGTLCPRRIVFLAKAELHEVPAFGRLVRGMGTLAVRRGESDREAVRLARETVRRGDLLGMFVEGTRQRSGEPGRALPGAAMVAIQEGAPVVPAAIYNSHAWRPGNFAPVSIAFGEPVRFDGLPRNSKGYREATAVIEAEVRGLWEFLGEMHRLGRPPGMPPGRGRAALPTETG